MSVVSKLDRRVVIGPVRVCYTNLFTPRSIVPGDELKFSCCFLVSKDNKAMVEKIRQAISRAQISGASMWGGEIPRELKLPLRDGDVERSEREEFVNHFFFNGTSREQPGVVDRRCRAIFDPREVYPGCYCNASLAFYPFNVGDSKGVACEIINIQKASEGEPITMRTTPEEDFQVIDEGDGDIFS